MFDLAEIDDRRVGGDGDRFGNGADGQADVDYSGLAGPQDDAGLLELLESLQFDGDTVRAERQQWGSIQSTLVADYATAVTGVDIRNGDGHAGQDSALTVDDSAFDGAVNRLASSDCRPTDGERQNKRRTDAKHDTLRGDAAANAAANSVEVITAVDPPAISAAVGDQGGESYRKIREFRE